MRMRMRMRAVEMATRHARTANMYTSITQAEEEKSATWVGGLDWHQGSFRVAQGAPHTSQGVRRTAEDR